MGAVAMNTTERQGSDLFQLAFELARDPGLVNSAFSGRNTDVVMAALAAYDAALEGKPGTTADRAHAMRVAVAVVLLDEVSSSLGICGRTLMNGDGAPA